MDIIVKTKSGIDWHTVSGLSAETATVNGTSFRLDNPLDQEGMIEALAGVVRFDIKGDGRFADAAADEFMRRTFFDGAVRPYQIFLQAIGAVRGDFQIAALEFAGESDGNVIYSIALTSCGSVEFENASAHTGVMGTD